MKKFLQLFVLALTLIFLAGCQDENQPVPEQPDPVDTRTIEEKAYDDSEITYSCASYSMVNPDSSWDHSEYLYDGLYMYKELADNYASTPKAWKAVMNYHKFELLDTFNVFGSGYDEIRKTDDSDSLRAEIEKANESGTKFIGYITDIYNIYTHYFSNENYDIMAKIEYLLDDKIVVKKPTGTTKEEGFYEQIMTYSVAGGNIVYSLLYPDYYQWEESELTACSLKDSNVINPISVQLPSVVEKDSISLSYNESDLISSEQYKYSYTNSWYKFRYDVDIPEDCEVSVSCKVDSSNLYKVQEFDEFGRVSLKYPGEYRITISVNPEDTELYASQTETFTVTIKDPFEDFAEKHLENLKNSFATVLVTMIYETTGLSDWLENETIKSIISDSLPLKNADISSLVDRVADFFNIQIPNSVKTLGEYKEIDNTLYKALGGNSDNDDKLVYSFLELFMPYYLNEFFNCVDDILGELSLISSHAGILYKNNLLSTDIELQEYDGLTVDALLALFTDESSAFYRIINSDMPYPLIDGTIITDEDEALSIAALLNLVNLIDNPSELINHTYMLDDLDWLVDCLQTPLYFEEEIYRYNQSTESYEFTLPELIGKIVQSPYLEKYLEIVDIDAKYYNIRSYVDNAVTDAKKTAILKATTLIQTLL